MSTVAPRPEFRVDVDSGHGHGAPAAGAPKPPPGSGAGAQRRRGSDEKRWFPWLVPTIFVADVVLFIITMSVNNCPKNSARCVLPFLGRFSFQSLKENPLLGPSTAALEKMGGLLTDNVVHHHQGWRLVTCIWLHAGVVHLLVNMLCLLLIGIRLEQEFGFVKVGLLYVISGIGGSLLSALFDQSTISVGASGALFGILGGMLSELIINWTIYANKFAAIMTLVIIIALNLALGILPHVDNFAHIGGLVSGFLMGFVILLRPQFSYVRLQNYPANHNGSSKSKHSSRQYIMLILALLLLIVGFAVALILLFRGYNANDHCSWCHYLSCVPTSKWSCNSARQSCSYYTSGNQLVMTCSNGKNGTYTSVNSNSTQVINDLCVQLCS